MGLFAIVVVAGIVIENPPKSSTKTGEKLDFSGAWEGTLHHSQGFRWPAILSRLRGGEIIVEFPGGILTIPLASITDEGSGRFRVSSNGDFLGIYKQSDEEIILCFRPEREGYPRVFRGGQGQMLLRLRRCKSPQ